jgi:hypothetical protein
MNQKYRMKTVLRRSATLKSSVALMALVAVLGLSGCSGTTDSTVSKDGTAITDNASGQNAQKGFVRPDLMGEVQSIIGNSVTIALAKVPTRDASTAKTTQGTQPTAGQMPSGPPPGDQGAQGGQGAQGTQARTQRTMTLTLTGETKEVLIPVGIEIMSGMGKSAKIVDIADIKKGSTIMIYYAEGTENIERVTIR